MSLYKQLFKIILQSVGDRTSYRLPSIHKEMILSTYLVKDLDLIGKFCYISFF